MKEPEELQAQIDVLRQVVFSLAALNPTNELIKDVRIRLEVWEDMNIPSQVSENYLDHVREESGRILKTLEALKNAHPADMGPSQPKRPAARKKAAVKKPTQPPLYPWRDHASPWRTGLKRATLGAS